MVYVVCEGPVWMMAVAMGGGGGATWCVCRGTYELPSDTYGTLPCGPCGMWCGLYEAACCGEYEGRGWDGRYGGTSCTDDVSESSHVNVCASSSCAARCGA